MDDYTFRKEREKQIETEHAERAIARAKDNGTYEEKYGLHDCMPVTDLWPIEFCEKILNSKKSFVTAEEFRVPDGFDFDVRNNDHLGKAIMQNTVTYCI